MPDPFASLHLPMEPAQPDPGFAAQLRDRLERALRLPKGVTVSNLRLEELETTEAARSMTHRPASVITPYIAVAGAPAALQWYQDALGARIREEPIVMPDGRVGHAELEIGGARLMLSEEHPEIGVSAPAAGRGATVTLHLSVDDVDGTIARAVAEGAALERAPADYPYGRNGVIRDPFGHRWMIANEVGPDQHRVRHGDIAYTSLWVPDVERAASFFARVLGWEYSPSSSPLGRQVEGLTFHHGLYGGHDQGTLFCCYAVRDIQEAVELVRQAGGTSGEPHPEPANFGFIAECTDDQGSPFAVYEPFDGVAAGDAPPTERSRDGDLVYVTMYVADSARARAFYGRVLGWRFAPGHIEDGWNVEPVDPMVGLAGGHPAAVNAGMYRVPDIEAAVQRIRASGGTATDPGAQPYGISAECRDDQGTPFWLLQA